MDKIITAKDVASREMYLSAHDWAVGYSRKLAQRGRIALPWTGVINGSLIKARIDWGRWLADCPYCNGAEYVDPDEPFLFCLSCGMQKNSGAALPVEFPPNRGEIEALVLARPVDDLRGGNLVEKALLARPLVQGLSRSWLPGETVNDLKEQNKLIKKGG